MLDLILLTKAIGDLDENCVLTMLSDFVAQKPAEAEVQKAITACQEGMAIVGQNYEKGDYFVGDLIYAGEILNGAIKILRPAFGDKGLKKVGKIVIGTVHGDLHDIGKNIFKSMAESAGFEVYDLGTDVPVEAFVSKVNEVSPEIVGLSGVLTMAIGSMKDTVDALKAAGLRDKVKVTIGGACASYDAMIISRADAWSTNAAETVDVCLGWVKK